ncbi:MAG: C40 family peptidase [Elusimicrobia bacterium]|nr:C40 family peptidase [Elusimicrobiota bacterium]
MWIKGALVLGILAAPVLGESKTIQQARNEIVAETLEYLNIPYLWGGQHPATGLDCSAFVRLVFGKSGLTMPRVSQDQFATTQYLAPSRILPGDIVFFSMKKPGSDRIDHVGIYVGKGYFVHASVTNGVHIDLITNPYYFARLAGIRKYQGF